MRILNYWMIKSKEKVLLKILDWCQKNKKKIQHLNYDDIIEALASPVRNNF